MGPVYLDHNAGTPLDERVLNAMLPYLQEQYGNPSSGHRLGLQARNALSQAREQVAALVNAHPSQVIFTSGGTEANNFALQGVMQSATQKQAGCLLVSRVEHASVLQTARALAQRGQAGVVEIDVDSAGRVNEQTLRDALSRCKQTPVLASVMYANNETGVLQDIPVLADVLMESGVLLHTDAVQMAGKLPLDYQRSGAALMSLSAHKLYGPKGVGALVVNKAVDKTPLLFGGPQEFGQRAGTENVAAIVGFGAAAEIAQAELEQNRKTALELRTEFEAGLRHHIPGVVVFAEDVAEKLPNTVFFSVPGIEGETLLMNLDQAGFEVSSGSACETGNTEPSHVLLAMGIDPVLARSAIRVSLGRASTQQQLTAFLASVKRIQQQTQRMAVLAMI